jgi:N4-gp56 family major capsid protein
MAFTATTSDVKFDASSLVGPVVTGTRAEAGIGDGVLAADAIKATFDKLIAIKQKAEPYYRRFATVRPAQLAYPGSTFDMFQYRDALDLAINPLDEYADPDYKPLKGILKKTFTLNEYGNATVTTLRLRDFSWASIDPMQAYQVGENMANSVDKIVENVLLTTPNKFYVASGAGNAVTAGDAAAAAGPLTSAAIRRIVAGMRSALAMPYEGNQYVAFIHPAAAVKLREETDAAGWRPAHIYTENANGVLFSGDIGTYEGVRFIETTRVPKDANGNYITFFLGKDGLLEAINREFSTVITPSTDKFGRLFGLGWYGCAGWGIYNTESVVAVASAGEATLIKDEFKN